MTSTSMAPNCGWKRRFLICVAFTVGLGGSAIAQTADNPLHTRYSQATSEAHPYWTGAKKFKEVLESESGGRIIVDLFANAQAGDEAASLQLLRSGALQFAEHSSSLAGSALNVPVIQGWSMPFLYPDAETAYRAWDSDHATQSYGKLEQAGIKCVERWDAGFRQLSSNRPIDSVDDVKGLKVRTPDGSIYINTWKALGGVPAPMAFAELYTSLQTGVVDGTELPVQLIYSDKFYEVQKYEAIINYINDPICFSVSKRFFDSLAPDLQQAVLKAAKESTKAERQAVQAGFQKAVDGIKAAGVTVTTPKSEPFRKAVAPVYEGYYAKTGEEGRKLVGSILELAGK